jgi:hypothetical protein
VFGGVFSLSQNERGVPQYLWLVHVLCVSQGIAAWQAHLSDDARIARPTSHAPRTADIVTATAGTAQSAVTTLRGSA